MRFGHFIDVLGKSHKFWGKMPVPSYITKTGKQGSIIKYDKTKISAEPYSCEKKDFYWSELDTTNEKEML